MHSPWCGIQLQPGALGRADGGGQGVVGGTTLFTLPGTGRDVVLVGCLRTLSKVGACRFDLAADVP